MTELSASVKPAWTAKLAIPKLYLLTNDDEFELLMIKLEAALATGAIELLQIRRKKVLASADGAAKLYQEAQQIVALAKKHQVAVVINDDVELARKLGVGVHLGQGDGSIIEAKRQLGDNQVIGRTCHDKVELVLEAQAEGATYAAMGAIFSSRTKPNAKTVSRAHLLAGCEQAIDICVIGGLSVENIQQLRGLPISYIAVVGDIMDLSIDKIASRCQQWQQALSSWYEVGLDNS